MSLNTFPGHYYKVSSKRSGSYIENVASCECGKGYTWASREVEHERHVLAVVWRAGYEDALAGRKTMHNPYAEKED